MVKEQFREQDTVHKIGSIQFTVGTREETIRQGHLKVFDRHLYQLDEKRTPVNHGPLDPRMGICTKDSKCATCFKGLVECMGHFGHVDLDLPVFQVGYFRAVLNILYCVCKSCGALLLNRTSKLKFRTKLFQPGLSYLSKKALKKQIVTQCKKVHVCPICKAPNGVVKKCGPLKIVHDKYRHAKRSDTFKDFSQTFESATDGKYGPLDASIEILNPLMVLNLFERITVEDIPFLVMGNEKFSGKPTDLLLKAIPVPPICIRPSVVSEIKSGTTEDDITVKISAICGYCEDIGKKRGDGCKIDMLMELWEFLQSDCALVINSELPLGTQTQQQGKKKFGRGFIQRLKGKQGRFRGNLSAKRVDFSGRSVISGDPNLLIQEVGIPVHMAKILTYPEKAAPFNLSLLRTLIRNGPDVHPGANFIVSKETGIRKFLRYGDRGKIAAELQPGDIVERHMFNGDVVLFNRQPSLHRLSIMSHLARVVPGRTLRFNQCVCAPYNADFDGDEMNIHLPQTEEAKAESLILMSNEVNLVTPRNGELIISATQDFLTGAYLMTRQDTFFSRSEASQIISWAAASQKEWVELPRPAILKPMQLWTGKQIISVIFRPNRESKVKLNIRAKGKNYTGEHGKEELDVFDSFIVVHNSVLVAGQLDKSTLGSGGKANVFFVLLRDFGKENACASMYRLARITSSYLMNRGFSIGIGDVTPTSKLLESKKKLVLAGYDKCTAMLAKPADSLESGEGKVLSELSTIRNKAAELCKMELSVMNTPLIMARCGSKGSDINISQMIACVGQQAINGMRVTDGFHERSLPHFRRLDRGPEAKGFVANSFFSGLTPSEFFFHAMGGREGLVDTAVKTAETGYMQRRLVKALEDLSCNYDMTVRNSEGQVIQLCYGEDGLDPMYMEDKDKPVDFLRVYLSCQAKYPERDAFLTAAEKETHMETVRTQARFDQDLVPSTLFQQEMKDFVMKSVFRSAQLIHFLQECWYKYYKTKMEPGTAVGALAAQSIGEPGTQMTLKTFHFAGVAAMNITLGVPRIKEIINAARNISTPIVTTSFTSEERSDAVAVKKLLQRTTLDVIADRFDSVISQDECHVVVHLNPAQLQKYGVTPHSVSEYVFKGLKLREGDRRLVRVNGNILSILPKPTKKSATYFMLQNLMKALPSVPIKGIPGINRTVLIHEKNRSYTLSVEGTNFSGVLATQGINQSRTTTNNISQIAAVLGIEAARQSIINEIHYTMDKHGMSVDKRHLTLVADLMTSRGEVLGITRHGLAKMKESVLMLASFEKTADHLFEAAYHGQRDVIAGVSESIIIGVQAGLGTGSIDMLEKPFDHPELEDRELLFESIHDKLGLK